MPAKRKYVKKPAATKIVYVEAKKTSTRRKSSGKRQPRYSVKPHRPYKPSGMMEAMGGAAGMGLGTYLGGIPGGAVGHTFGKKAGDFIARMTGVGDYRVNVNTLFTDPVPEFKSKGNRCTTIKHREFISDVFGGAFTVSNSSTDFLLRQYRINPGDSSTFPWLSQVAQNYEQYRFHGLAFEYKTTSGAISTAPMLGTVVMATQYNSLAQSFVNKQQMENYEFACSTVPSANVIHPIECDPKETQCNGIFNVLTNRSFSGGDVRLFDLGLFSIATVGLPFEGENCGELWVTYDVCLMKPRLVPDSGGVADHYHQVNNGTGIDLPSTYWNVDFMEKTTQSDNFTVLGNGIIYINPSFNGRLMVLADWANSNTGPTAAFEDVTMTGTLGASPLDLLQNNSTNQNVVKYATNTNAIHSVGFFQIDQPGPNTGVGVLGWPTITFTGGVFPAANQPYSCDLFIIEIPDDLD